MTPEEETKFEAKLREKYVLIPKDKLYYIIGGALAVVIIATGISLASVFAYLHTEPAEIARKRIEDIRTEAEGHLQRPEQESTYIRYDDQVSLFPAGSSKAIAGWIGSGNTGVKPYDANSSAFRWTVRREKNSWPN